MFAFLTGKLGLPVRLWLVNPDGTSKFTGKGLIPDLNEPSSGSAKNDAYRWAIRHYIDSGKCDARLAAYYIDAFWLKSPTGDSGTFIRCPITTISLPGGGSSLTWQPGGMRSRWMTRARAWDWTGRRSCRCWPP